MKNILYIDDYINLYSNKLNKIINYKPYKKTLWLGRIIDKNKFIKSFLKLKEQNAISNNILSEDLIIIISSIIKEEDKNLFKEIMEELNYKKVYFINELDLIKLTKDYIFINFNYTYFYIYYIQEDGKVNLNIYNKNEINTKIILNIIKLFNKKIIITGKNYQELLNILKNTDLNYYFYEENNNLFINLLLKNKNV